MTYATDWAMKLSLELPTINDVDNEYTRCATDSLFCRCKVFQILYTFVHKKQ